MLSSIGQNNNVQRFSAVNALKTSANLLKPKETDTEPEFNNNVETVMPKGLLDRIDTEEVRKYAEYVGEFNISDEEIKYGMLYGRSVIAEYLA